MSYLTRKSSLLRLMSVGQIASTLVSLSEEVRDNAPAGRLNFPAPPPPLPPPAITYPPLQYPGTQPPPPPPLVGLHIPSTSSSSSSWQCGSFPTFLPWCLGVSALQAWSRAGPITPEFTDGTAPADTLHRSQRPLLSAAMSHDTLLMAAGSQLVL